MHVFNRPKRESLFDRLKRGLPVTNDDFDRIYPKAVSDVSRVHWTPVECAQTAARMLAAYGAHTVLDAGSGAGKFALVAACTKPTLTITGVEQRAYLVDIANTIASDFAITNAHFEEGDALERDWSSYDAVYLYNPFVENLFEPGRRVDHIPDLSAERYDRDVDKARARLSAMRPGSFALTFHGYGAEMPEGWRLIVRDVSPLGVLQLWGLSF